MIEAIYPKVGERWPAVLLWSVIVTMLSAGNGHARLAPTGGQVVTPGSSIEKPGDVGVRAHTNIQLFIPDRSPPGPPSPSRGGGEGGAANQRPPSTGNIGQPQ
jgi:hypothetical protein